MTAVSKLTAVSKRGQVWSSDLALSILIFAVMSVVVLTLITNVFEDVSLDDVALQATGGAQYLSEAGFPAHWTADDVIRAGIVSDGRISRRKLAELSMLSDDDLRSRLRIKDHFVLYATNGSGAVVPLSGSCSFGDIDVEYNASNASLEVLAVIGNGTSPHPVVDGVSARVNLTLATLDSSLHVLDRFDLIIFEGNITGDAAASSDMFSLMLSAALKRGITLVIIGDPGSGFAGIRLNRSTATSIDFDGDGGVPLGFPPSEELIIAPAAIPVAPVSSNAAVSHRKVLASTDAGDAAAVSYLYDDALIYYIATSDGVTASGPSVEDALIAGLSAMALPSSPICGQPVIPSAATDVSHASRFLPQRDSVLSLHLVVWRGP